MEIYDLIRNGKAEKEILTWQCLHFVSSNSQEIILWNILH